MFSVMLGSDVIVRLIIFRKLFYIFEFGSDIWDQAEPGFQVLFYLITGTWFIQSGVTCSTVNLPNTIHCFYAWQSQAPGLKL